MLLWGQDGYLQYQCKEEEGMSLHMTRPLPHILQVPSAYSSLYSKISLTHKIPELVSLSLPQIYVGRKSNPLDVYND